MSPSPDAMRDMNQRAWNTDRYEGWVRGDGTPAELAARLCADPRYTARRWLHHLGDVAGKRICNLQGSRGKAAVSLALLGADVTVVDFAQENRRYAMELAEAAGVSVDYRVADSLSADTLGLGRFDVVLMELGILHYHQDIARFFAVVRALLKSDGATLLHDFHPVQRKLFVGLGDHEPDYFYSGIVMDDVPSPDGGPSPGKCAYRFWTLGEVLSAILAAGFEIRAFEELPSWDDPRLPGLYTVLARAAS